jgi:hypothetical protein
LSDKFGKSNIRIKANISIWSSALAAPAMAVCLLYQENFWLSISMLGFNYLTAEAWGSPTITML